MYIPGRLIIVTEIISPYRIPVFNRLSDILGERFLVLFMAESEAKRQWTVSFEDIRFQYEILPGLKFRRKKHLDTTHFWNPSIYVHLNRFKPTLIVVGGYHHFTSYFVLSYAKLKNIKLLLWCENNINDFRSNSLFTEFVKRVYVKSCDGCIVPGNASKIYLKNYDIGSNKIVTAPNAIDTELFKKNMPSIGELDSIRSEFRRQWGLAEFNLLFVGRLSPEKGVPVVLKILSMLQHDGMDVGLIIVGDGPLRNEYESIVRKDDIKHTAFVGFQEQCKLPFYYSQGDILIMPSKSEAWGLVVNEAMTCGVPVICSKSVGAAEDMVVQGETGYVCGSILDYISKIKILIASESLSRNMAFRCMEMSKGFTPEKCAEGFTQALNRFN